MCRRRAADVEHPPRAMRVEGVRTWAEPAKSRIRPDRPKCALWPAGIAQRSGRCQQYRPSLIAHTDLSTRSGTRRCRIAPSIARSCPVDQGGPTTLRHDGASCVRSSWGYHDAEPDRQHKLAAMQLPVVARTAEPATLADSTPLPGTPGSARTAPNAHR